MSIGSSVKGKTKRSLVSGREEKKFKQENYVMNDREEVRAATRRKLLARHGAPTDRANRRHEGGGIESIGSELLGEQGLALLIFSHRRE